MLVDALAPVLGSCRGTPWLTPWQWKVTVSTTVHGRWVALKALRLEPLVHAAASLRIASAPLKADLRGTSCEKAQLLLEATVPLGAMATTQESVWSNGSWTQALLMVCLAAATTQTYPAIIRHASSGTRPNGCPLRAASEAL